MSEHRRVAAPAIVLFALLLVACGGGGGSDATPTPVPLTTVTAEPGATATQVLRPTPEVVIPNTSPAPAIELPDGFTAYVVAQGFLRASTVAIGPDRTIYVSERHGNVFQLEDANGDGLFEKNILFASGFDDITGLLVAPDGAVLVSSSGKVTVVRDTDGDGAGDNSSDLVTGLPFGLHQNNGLVFGPDGKIYLTNGSTCDECVEEDERSATILQVNPDGTDLRVYASGLRNAYDLAFDSGGRLWATDNGSDEPCETIDELDLIVEGGDYGWPYADDGCDPFQDGIPPAADLGLHTAATGVTVYEASHFPPTFQGRLFATVWGSFLTTPDPYDRVLLTISLSDGPGGEPAGAVEEFASGFTHPIDVLVDRDGTLLVLDYGGDDPDERTGRLYRIVYTGG